MNKSVVFMLVTVAALSACGQAKTQDYYMSHPDELTADLAACKEHGKSTFDCNEADKAALLVKNQKRNATDKN
jgi:hypothetical protein